MSVALERTPYIGRVEQRAEVMDVLRAAAAGRGGLGLVAGEAGVGKTRFALEIAAEAETMGFLALVGRSRESDAPAPYAPLVDLIARAIRSDGADWFRRELGDEAAEFARLVPEIRTRFPDIPPAVELPPEQERRYLFDSFWRVLVRASAGVPILIVVDDLQLADAASLHLLEYVAKRIGGVRAFLLATHRHQAAGVDDPLVKTLRSIAGRVTLRVDLKRLNSDEVAAMLAALAGGPPPPPVVAVINGETDGNPFFVEEVVKHLQDEGRLFDKTGAWRSDIQIGELEVPGSIRLVIGRRLERLTPGTRALLESSAVAGRSISLALFGELAEDGIEPITARAEAESAGLISTDPPGMVTFSHQLVRQTLENGLAPDRRRLMHVQVAAAIERAHAGKLDEVAPDLAHHLLAAGPAADPARTLAALEAAGSWALAATAFEEARTYFAATLDMLSSEGTAERARALHLHGIALSGVSRWDDAMDAWDEALQIAEALGDTELAGRVCANVVLQLGWVGRWMDVVRFVARGLAAVGKRSSHRALLLAIQGAILAGAGDHATGAAYGEMAIDLAEDLGDPRLLGQCFFAKSGRLLIGMRVAESLAAAERALALLRSAGALYDLAGVLGPTIIAASLSGRFDRASAITDELAPLVERLGHHGGIFGLHTQRGFRALADGPNLTAFETEARASEELGRRAGMTTSLSVGPAQLGLAQFLRGHPVEAVSQFRRSIELELPGSLAGSSAGLLLIGLAYAGDRDGVLSEWNDRRQTLPVAGRATGIGSWTTMFGGVEALAMIDEHAEAAALAPLIGEAISQGTLHREWDLRSLHTLAGIAARCAGRWDDAERHFQKAIALADAVPIRLEAAESRRFYAEMLLARGRPGDPARAGELLGQALEIYDPAGMKMHARIARELLERR